MRHKNTVRYGDARGGSGFTLVELLVVVIILGFLAAIIIPQLSNASTEARESMLRENLRTLRMQIACYMAQHYDTPPGYPGGDRSQAATAELFVSQLTGYSDANGNTNAAKTAVYCYGPYLRKMPENPISAATNVLMLGINETLPAGSMAGWAYKPELPGIWAGCDGTDINGRSYGDY